MDMDKSTIIGSDVLSKSSSKKQKKKKKKSTIGFWITYVKSDSLPFSRNMCQNFEKYKIHAVDENKGKSQVPVKWKISASILKNTFFALLCIHTVSLISNASFYKYYGFFLFFGLLMAEK